MIYNVPSFFTDIIILVHDNRRTKEQGFSFSIFIFSKAVNRLFSTNVLDYNKHRGAEGKKQLRT